MIFTQPVFALFLAAVLALHWFVLRSNRSRKAMLLVGSYVFYGWWDPRFLLLIALMTVVNYVAGLMIARATSSRPRDLWLLASIVVDLGVLATFKYANFFLDSLQTVAESFGIGLGEVTLNITLPVGISFFTFQAMSYTIDVHRGRLEARRSLFDVALYIAFFPQLVAGPIVRAAAFLPQLDVARRLADVAWRRAVGLFLVGFFKKAVLADTIGAEIDPFWSDPGSYDQLSAVFGVLGYAAQIYCDFSGYSDMAIAVAMMLGYQLLQNFNYPYFASSLTDFWRRWHISLSSWLRDYLYIPLGGNRRGKLMTYRNLLITMVLGGLWHGAAWTFVIWGAMHGVGLAVEKWWFDRRPAGAGRAAAGEAPPSISLGTLATFGYVCVAWVLFRAADLTVAGDVLAGVSGIGANGAESVTRWVGVYVAVGVVLHWVSARRIAATRLDRLSTDAYAAILGVSTAVILALQPVGAAPFIYFQF